MTLINCGDAGAREGGRLGTEVLLVQDTEAKAIYDKLNSTNPDNVQVLFALGEYHIENWENEEALNAYRHSDFFAHTWKRTKALFAERAEAWSVDTVEEVMEK